MAERQGRARPEAPGKAPQQVKKVLAVDDEPYMLTLMRITLDGTGWQVLEALDGAQGLDLARRERPDLVLLDVLMPGIDGLEVCRALKADPTTAHIPVIMLTAKTGDDDVSAGLSAGADDYITKPFSPRALLDKVADLLDRA